MGDNMKVIVEVVGIFIAMLKGRKVIHLEFDNDDITINDVLEKLRREYSFEFKWGPENAIFLNGIPVEFYGGLKAKLKHGDRILIVPAAFGG